MIIFFDDINIGYTCGIEISPVYPITFKIGYMDYSNECGKSIRSGILLNFSSLDPKMINAKKYYILSKKALNQLFNDIYLLNDDN